MKKKNQINKEIKKEIYAAEEEIRILKKNSINKFSKNQRALHIEKYTMETHQL